MRRPLAQQIELVLSLTKRDLKARYKESVFGFLWSFFRPALLTLILWLVFAVMLRLPAPSPNIPYWLHMLVSVLLWNYFAGSIIESTHSLVANANLIKKVALDAEVFPIACILSNAIHLALALALAFIIIIFTTGQLSWHLLLLPVFVAVGSLTILALSLLFAALNVLVRDIGSAVDLLLQAWFYLTPILYPVSMAQERINQVLGPRWFDLYMANPVAPVMVGARYALLYGNSSAEMGVTSMWSYLGVATAVGLALLIPSWAVFRRLNARFADEL